MKKPHVLLAVLLTCLTLHTRPASAWSPVAQAPVTCDYQETRNPVPINPKTKKPYTVDERHQEPFDGDSISKAQIKACLRLNLYQPKRRWVAIKNHHIVFEDYRDGSLRRFLRI
ncbi:MAG: hypothetical protein ETSY1_17875 [Candidatus Entotheonella factor]|uniref:PepSY domain-containing protein n=1 Tax=Entotheonella factor TaxID=1429438 RepID=W4LMQ7_ENTF1|nr:MAG: hypothetical protein ETSY1_17875 [Candidatus Entotheonella factor]